MPISVQSTKFPPPSGDRAPPGGMYRGARGLYSVLQVSQLLTAQKAPQETRLVPSICLLPKRLFKNAPSTVLHVGPSSMAQDACHFPSPKSPNKGVLAGISALLPPGEVPAYSWTCEHCQPPPSSPPLGHPSTQRPLPETSRRRGWRHRSPRAHGELLHWEAARNLLPSCPPSCNTRARQG